MRLPPKLAKWWLVVGVAVIHQMTEELAAGLLVNRAYSTSSTRTSWVILDFMD